MGIAYKLLNGLIGCIQCCGCGGAHSNVGRGDDEPVPALEELGYPVVSEEELDAYLETLQTGDMLLVCQTSGFGMMTQTFDKTPWDHCAMVLRPSAAGAAEQAAKAAETKLPTKVYFSAPEPSPPREIVWQPPCAGQLQVFEANGTGSWCFPLQDWLACRGPKSKYVAVRTLRREDGAPLDEARRAQLEAFALSVWGRPYQQNPLELVKAVVADDPQPAALADKGAETLESIFCSELNAEALQRAGVLPERSLNSNQVLPSMFDVGGACEALMASVQPPHGYRLDARPTMLKAPGSACTRRAAARRAREGWEPAAAAATASATPKVSPE